MIRPKSLLPRSLYGRAALILIVPIVTIQLVVSIAFIQRHFDRVTQQMTRGVAIELQALQVAIGRGDVEGKLLAATLQMEIRPADDRVLSGDSLSWFDLTGSSVIEALRDEVPGLRGVDLASDSDEVRLVMDTPRGPVGLTVDRKRVSASNPHQLLVLMIFTSILMTVIAYIFLRNQLRPIKRLAVAADAFGKGRHVDYRPGGAVEVRAAGSAFLDMRARIERQIEQRTLMLSGVSHDLRTPLTRLRLGLSLLPEDGESAALLGDVADMERLVDEFLAFARGDAMEEAEEADVQVLVRRLVENAQRAGQDVKLGTVEGPSLARLRAAAVGRAVENLLGNAVRYGGRARVSLVVTERAVKITVEDAGPGIPKERRDEAMMPFSRLDTARDPNKGGGVGLGLSIAADIARSHGGALRLGESEALGGLKAELVLAR
jgi:two-component system, OmpR family, osmolarity sensor histidine kinase EnvZ